MGATPYPLPREIRESAIDVGDGTAGPYGPTTFKVFDTADIEVWAKADGEDFFSDVTGDVTVAKTADAAFDTVSVTFDEAVPATTEFVIRSTRTHERQVAVTKGGAIDSDQLEKELSRQGSVLEELRRDIDRTVQTDPGVDPVRLAPGAAGALVTYDAGGNVVASDENVASLLDATERAETAAEAAETSVLGDIAAAIHAATNKATPVDADELGIWDSVTGLFNRLSWANVKATLTATFLALTGAQTIAGVKTFSSNPVLSGGGLQFPATQAPSADANCLDDYEEGTFTPAYSATGCTFNYASQNGRYTKIGRLVLIEASMALATSGNTLAANPLSVTGLPFSAGFGPSVYALAGYYFCGTSYIQVSINTNGTALDVKGNTAAAVGNTIALNANAFLHATNGTGLRAAITYSE